MVTAKVSPQGQVFIPAQLRRQAGMEIGSEVIIEPSEEGILIFPVSGELKQKRFPFDAEPAFGLWRDDLRSDEELLDELGGNWAGNSPGSVTGCFSIPDY